MALLLGVDAGGTRSTAWVVDANGALRGRADGGPANFQSIGSDAARANLADLVTRALGAATADTTSVAWAAYGVSGADRPKDFDAVRALLPDLGAPERRTLVNDAALVLRAGTPDGVGVALISGTGVNAIGRSASGRVAHVGGLAGELGDFGAAADLGREALRLAMRGHDGRGAPTLLYERLCTALGLARLEDIVDTLLAADSQARAFGRLAPLVFEAARDGDGVARELLERAGRELGLSARLLIEKLFPAGERVTVVLGGSVLQRGVDPTLVRTIAAELSRLEAPARVVRLTAEPVAGAVLLAKDAVADGADDVLRFREALGATCVAAL